MVVHIIEDDAAVADAIAMALTDMKYRPATYRDGESFLAEADVSAEDLVIVDLGLPGISGTDIARRLNERSDPPRIIIISGKPQVRLSRHMRDLPRMIVLRKPLSFEALCDAMA